MMNGETVLLVTAMKNEGPYVLEWVAHHMAMGIDSIMVISNDCDDQTDRLLDRLAQIVPVHHRINPRVMFRDQGNWQVMALRFAQMHNFYKDADWIFYADADEFLHVTTGDGTLDAFHAEASRRAGRFDAVSFSSIPFNSSGIKTFSDDLVVEQFTQTNKPYAMHREAGREVLTAIKTMFRNAVNFRIRRNHRPLMEDFSDTDHVWIDGSANIMPKEFTDGKVKGVDAIRARDLAQLNHYAIKSAESFLIKQDRGDVAGVDRLDTERRYWESYNDVGDSETRFVVPSAAAAALFATFMADPLLAKYHAEAVAAHRAKAKRLRNTPALAGMVDRLGLSPDTLAET